MKIRILLLVTAVILSAGILLFNTATVALSGTPVENKGAAEIKLPAGKRGDVLFPHRRHQDKLGDCNICHSVFPQKAGVIKALKSEGKLKKKHVMNKLCTKCHRQKKKEGIKSGPTTCSKCHIKEKK